METTSPSAVDSPSLMRRTFVLLRLLAAAGRRGVALTDLARLSGLAHATVHRLMQQLMAEQAVVQHVETRRYALGPLTFELGMAAYPYDLRHHSRDVLERLALETRESVFLSLRSGDEAVCIDLQPSPSPIRVVTLELGSRRPLGAGAGGLAILGGLDGTEREEVIARVSPLLQRDWQLGDDVLRQSLDHFAREGHALIRNRVHAGVSAVGYPVRGPLGRPIAALSIAALNESLTSTTVPPLVRRLRAAALELERRLRADGGRWMAH